MSTAGGSEGALRLAADFADVVFTVAQTRARAVAFRDEVRSRAVAAGRDPDALKVSLGVVVLVGLTTLGLPFPARATGGQRRYGLFRCWVRPAAEMVAARVENARSRRIGTALFEAGAAQLRKWPWAGGVVPARIVGMLGA